MFFSVRISGNAASDKNIKDGVCAQIEKNFAKAKWKVRSIFYYIFVFSLLFKTTRLFFIVLFFFLLGVKQHNMKSSYVSTDSET